MIKVGQILTAKKTCCMRDYPNEICLKKGHKYKIIGIYSDCFIINSECSTNHYWENKYINRDFNTTNNMLKNIIVI